jgi:hypothetical protein
VKLAGVHEQLTAGGEMNPTDRLKAIKKEAREAAKAASQGLSDADLLTAAGAAPNERPSPPSSHIRQERGQGAPLSGPLAASMGMGSGGEVLDSKNRSSKRHTDALDLATSKAATDRKKKVIKNM